LHHKKTLIHNDKAMKTQNITAAIKLVQGIVIMAAFQYNFLLAGTPVEKGGSNIGNFCIPCIENLFLIQREAMADISVLAPVTPKEADFKDEASNIIPVLAPTTPSEAVFEDDPGFTNVLLPGNLTPATPAVADFTD
jgi:hypothetical protein